MSIAFFDFDLTLIAANSARLWLRRELALGQITRSQALRAGFWLARYQVGFASMEQAVERAIGMLAGTRSDALAARTASFYERQVRPLFRPGARSAIAWHRARRDRLVLLTSSSNYLAELVAAELGFQGVLCNRLQVDAAGLHTGRTTDGLCFGMGKLAFARREAAAQGVSLADCCFYTDSFSDLPVMEAVGRPVAVNPDPRLRRRATRAKWQIADWGTPG